MAVKNEEQQLQQQQQQQQQQQLQLEVEESHPEVDVVLIKHKEIAALWELLKLATAQGQSSIQTRTTLANVLLSTILIQSN